MRPRILIPLITLAVAAQTCCCCTILGGPQPPYAITPSDEALHRLAERMDEAEQSADDFVTVTVTEEEMTSLIAQILIKQEESSITQPQVHFRNGRVEVYSTVQVADSLALPGLVAFSVATADGRPAVTVEEVALGPLPIPESILETLADMLNQALSENVQFEEAEILITDVHVGDGEMTISGQVQSD